MFPANSKEKKRGLKQRYLPLPSLHASQANTAFKYLHLFDQRLFFLTVDLVTIKDASQGTQTHKHAGTYLSNSLQVNFTHPSEDPSADPGVQTTVNILTAFFFYLTEHPPPTHLGLQDARFSSSSPSRAGQTQTPEQEQPRALQTMERLGHAAPQPRHDPISSNQVCTRTLTIISFSFPLLVFALNNLVFSFPEKL